MRRHEKAPQRAQRTEGLSNGAPLSGLTAHFRPFASGGPCTLSRQRYSYQRLAARIWISARFVLDPRIEACSSHPVSLRPDRAVTFWDVMSLRGFVMDHGGMRDG